MNIKKFFNLIIILQLIFSLFSGIIGSFEKTNIPYIIEQYFSEQYELIFENQLGVIGISLIIIFFAIYVVACISLLKRRNFARKLYLFSICMSLINFLILDIGLGYSLNGPIEKFLMDISVILIGITLGFIYFGDERRFYHKNSEQLDRVSKTTSVKLKIGLVQHCLLKKVTLIVLIGCVLFLLGASLKFRSIRTEKVLSKKFPNIKTPDEMLQQYIKDPGFPVKYDLDTDEYNIEYGSIHDKVTGKRSIRVYFCPLSGAELRISKNKGSPIDRLTEN